MISLQEDHINSEAVEVYYQTPEDLKLQNSAEHKVVVHDDDIDSVPIDIDNHLDVPVAPVKNPEDYDFNHISNPVDAIKRRYDSVIIAKDGDNYYADANDVQKCANLNCESVIETLNNIIRVNEDNDINQYNFGIIISESTSIETINTFKKANVKMINIG